MKTLSGHSEQGSGLPEVIYCLSSGSTSQRVPQYSHGTQLVRLPSRRETATLGLVLSLPGGERSHSVTAWLTALCFPAGIDVLTRCWLLLSVMDLISGWCGLSLLPGSLSSLPRTFPVSATLRLPTHMIFTSQFPVPTPTCFSSECKFGALPTKVTTPSTQTSTDDWVSELPY